MSQADEDGANARLAAPAEFKFASDIATGEFEGYASVFGNVDLGGDVVERGAFAETLRSKAAGDVLMLFQHDHMGFPIGDWLEMRENDRGLVVRGRLDLSDPDGARAHNAMTKGRLKGLSIGYRIKANGAEYDSGRRVRRIKAADLFEVSVVSMPMNPRATVARVKSIPGDQPPERVIEAALRDAGFSRKDALTLISQAKARTRQGDPAVGEAVTAADLQRLVSILRS